jgi:hypothetical protein
VLKNSLKNGIGSPAWTHFELLLQKGQCVSLVRWF